MLLNKALRFFVLTLAGAALGACIEHTAPGTMDVTSQAAPAKTQQYRASIARRSSAVAAQTDESIGIASFYSHGSITANGERFNPSELTAAHRTLPFGTRLRVTDMTTGQSVTVRVNDRGPFIPGRVVDVSHRAAEALGIVDRGITKVKLEVEK